MLQVAAPLDTRNALLRQSALLMTLLILVTAAGTLAGSWWLAGRAIRPVHEIIDQAEGIGAQTLRRRISAHADSREYERLVQVLNTMLSRIDATFEAQRRFASDASHELRSPLTALKGELELARRRRRTPEEYERAIDSALEEVVGLTRLAEDLLTLARFDAGQLDTQGSDLDLHECASTVLERLGASAQEKNVRLTIAATGDATVTGDRDLVCRLVWNLVSNGIRHTPPGGDVNVSIVRENGSVNARVTDTGPGIPQESLPHIFERFYRADDARTPTPDRQHTGLGLAIVRAIAELHGARLTVTNGPEGGAEFDVRFPVPN
jgi:two-component system OmpR family sensor kinase